MTGSEIILFMFGIIVYILLFTLPFFPLILDKVNVWRLFIVITVSMILLIISTAKNDFLKGIHKTTIIIYFVTFLTFLRIFLKSSNISDWKIFIILTLLIVLSYISIKLKYKREGFENTESDCYGFKCMVTPVIKDGKPEINFEFKIDDINELNELRVILSNPQITDSMNIIDHKIFKVLVIKKSDLIQKEVDDEFNYTYKLTDNIFNNKKYNVTVLKYTNTNSNSEPLRANIHYKTDQHTTLEYKYNNINLENPNKHPILSDLDLNLNDGTENFTSPDYIDFKISKKENSLEHKIQFNVKTGYDYALVFYVNNDGPYIEKIENLIVDNNTSTYDINYLIGTLVYKFAIVGIPNQNQNQDKEVIVSKIKEIKLDIDLNVSETIVKDFYTKVCCKANGEHTLTDDCTDCYDYFYEAKSPGSKPFSEETHKQIMKSIETEPLKITVKPTFALENFTANDSNKADIDFIMKVYDLINNKLI